MKRHLIYGRFGAADRVEVPLAEGEVATRLPFVQAKRRLDHGIGDALDDLAKLGLFPSEVAVDLLALAAHVQAADTHLSRETESQDGWSREIRLVVPVSDPGRWNVTLPLLQRLLNFLTGDRWIVGFRARPTSFEQIVSPRPAQLERAPSDSLSLFSGGLDSLIWAIDCLEQNKTPLLISHAGDGATSDAQGALMRGLTKNYPSRNLNRMRIWMDFRGWGVKGVGAEKTSRGRSFLFFAAGVLAGTALDSSFVLGAPENGLIALNVPLDPLRVGAFSTRTTHPFYVARWNELLEMLGIPGRIENPYWNKTKGEMVANCANPSLLANLAPKSLSCASPTKGRWLGRGIEHCGFCLPCLIRRAALRGNDHTSYTLANLTARELSTRKAQGQQVRSFQFAIERIRAKPELAPLFIHKPGPLSDLSPERRAALADVYRRGLAEVDQLLAEVSTTPD